MGLPARERGRDHVARPVERVPFPWLGGCTGGGLPITRRSPPSSITGDPKEFRLLVPTRRPTPDRSAQPDIPGGHVASRQSRSPGASERQIEHFLAPDDLRDPAHQPALGLHVSRKEAYAAFRLVPRTGPATGPTADWCPTGRLLRPGGPGSRAGGEDPPQCGAVRRARRGRRPHRAGRGPQDHRALGPDGAAEDHRGWRGALSYAPRTGERRRRSNAWWSTGLVRC
jgi:hypothetical protein